MRKLLLLLILGFCTIANSYAQSKMACCVKPKSEASTVTANFASLGQEADFREKHENPLPFTLHEQKGKMIRFSTPDGKSGNAYEIKAHKKTDNYVFVIHEWWGLNDYIKKEAQLLAKDLGNVNVLALDLYDGREAATREQASEYMQAVSEDRAKAIINGAIKYAGEDADIATIGWCFGGGWALQAGILASKDTEAIVMYYGMPEQNVERLKQLKAPVLGIFASQDSWISPKVVEEFKQNMKKAGKELTVKMYNAEHAFANPSNPKYNAQYANEAHKLAVGFIKKHLD